MNNFTAFAKLSSSTELRYSQDSTPFVGLSLEIQEGYGDNLKSFIIQAKAWGKTAESIQKVPTGAGLHVSGSLNMLSKEVDGQKDTFGCLNISEFSVIRGSLPVFNRISLIGNTGRDVETMHFESGKNNAKTSIAVYRDRDNSDWFPIECWGKVANTMDTYVTKGSSIGVLGRLKCESWQDKSTGRTRSRLIVNCDRLSLLGKKSKADDDSHAAPSQTQYQAQSQPQASTPESDFSDIPF